MGLLHCLRTKIRCLSVFVLCVSILLLVTTISMQARHYVRCAKKAETVIDSLPKSARIQRAFREIRSSSSSPQNSPHEASPRTGFLDKVPQESSCQFPNYQPYDPTTLKFLKVLPEGYQCPSHYGPDLVKLEGGTLILNTSSLSFEVECSYQVIHSVSHFEVTFSRPYRIKGMANVPPGTERVRVQCYAAADTYSQRKPVYENFHNVMVEKPEVEEEQSRLTLLRLQRFQPVREDLAGDVTPGWINVLITGIDSLSRFNFIRSMRRTRHFLLNELQAIELTNYNKVGDGTFPNTLALMAGLLPKEFNYNRSKNIDLHPGLRFLWNEYADEGYRTLMVRDHRYPQSLQTRLSDYQHYAKQPTHYYTPPMENAKDRFSNMYSPFRQCFRGSPNDQLMLNYAVEFCRLFRDKPHFAYTWLVTSTHDNLNGGFQIDGYYENYLRTLWEEGLLNNTLLVFYSDHGYRWLGFRNTPVGKFEEMRPFMFLVFPPWFKKAYPALVSSVQTNAARFTTHRDVHRTLIDLLFLNSGDMYKENRLDWSLGLSLFGEIPRVRTCEEAGILPEYCVCLNPRPVSTDLPLVVEASASMLMSLNAALADVRNSCVDVTLSNVMEAVRWEGEGLYYQNLCQEESSLVGTENHAKETVFLRVVVAVQEDEDVLFEGALFKCGDSGEFRLQGDIRRFSRREGKEVTSPPSCIVDSPSLGNICICK